LYTDKNYKEDSPSCPALASGFDLSVPARDRGRNHKIKNMENELPEDIKDFFGSFAPCIFDAWCGECIGWGFKPNQHLGDILFSKCREYGKWVCLYPNWYLVTKELTPLQATGKYGKITALELGPRGGFRSVTYGDKRFLVKELDPRELPSSLYEDVVIVV